MSFALSAHTPPRVESRSMAILIPALFAAFAAFCIWLAVRIVNRRERWAKWTSAVVAVMVIFYPLSVGPASGLFAHHILSEQMMPTFKIIYAPLQLVIQWGVDSRSPWFEDGFFWYMGIWGVEPEILGSE